MWARPLFILSSLCLQRTMIEAIEHAVVLQSSLERGAIREKTSGGMVHVDKLVRNG